MFATAATAASGLLSQAQTQLPCSPRSLRSCHSARSSPRHRPIQADSPNGSSAAGSSPRSHPALVAATTRRISSTTNDVCIVNKAGSAASSPFWNPTTPLVNSTTWYKSPHGFASIHSTDVDIVAEMDDLVLDSGKEHDQATQGLLQDEPVADVDVEHQRLTFANITKNVSEQNAENLEEKLNPLSSYSSEQVTSTYSNFIDGSVVRVPKTTASGIHKLRWFQPLLSKSLPGFSTSVKSSPPHSPRNFPALPDETTMYESRDKKNEYRTIKQLGKGAQGVVSYSVHVATNSKVAFKAIPIYSMVDGNVRESFRREIVILKKLQGHRNVIKLLDCWEGKAKVYQVFECCEGGDLSLAIAKAFPMSEKLRGHLFYPIVDAVNFLHSYGILHRDIRPANILIRRPFTSNQAPESLLCLPVLADFGIAMEEKYASGRMLTQFLDRPPHIAPEVVDGHPFGRPADVFGLGVCLITILLNRPIDICDQDKTLVSRESAWARLSAMEKRLVKKLLEVNPKQRLTALEAVNDEWFKAAGVV